MSRGVNTKEQLARARTTAAEGVLALRPFLIRRAQELTTTAGFTYRTSGLGPSTYADLRREYDACRASRLPLRIWPSNLGSTIFSGVDADQFDFWHACTHVELRADFDRSGEIEVGQQQLGQAEMAGLEAYSPGWRMLFALTIGRLECLNRLGVHPRNWDHYLLDYLASGLVGALKGEGIRQGIKPIWELSNVLQMASQRPFVHTVDYKNNDNPGNVGTNPDNAAGPTGDVA
jgi:hypothetical protein